MNGPRFLALLVVLLASGTAGCADEVSPIDPSVPQQHAARDRDPTQPVHIVMFTDDVADPSSLANALAQEHGGEIVHLYKALNGFAIGNLPERAIESLQRNPGVRYVEKGRELREVATQSLPSRDYWGLDRVDQFGWTFDDQFHYFFTGAGVHIYVVDSGIRGDHVEFAGRLGNGVTKMHWDPSRDPYEDTRGHGTAVASAAAGTTYGIAKGAVLHSVRVNDADSLAYSYDIAAGLDWVAANAVRPAVANLSFNTTGSQAVADAMKRVIDAGVVMVKAAGNGNGITGNNACNDVGNTVGYAIVVSAVWGTDRADWADYGSCVDLFAPGNRVIVAGRAHSTDWKVSSGTSIAAPYVAGVAATVLEQRPNARSDWLEFILGTTATQNAINASSLAGSPNRLLNSLHRSAGITGTDYFSSPGTYTWGVNTLGGDGTWSFRWLRSVAGGPYEVVSYSGSYTHVIEDQICYDMTLKLEATSFGATVHGEKNVQVRTGLCMA